MTKRSRGSEWRVVTRCYALLRRLMRAPAGKDEMLEIIRLHDDEPEDVQTSILESRLEGDRERLRVSLNCIIEYVHADRLYYLRALAHPMIDLSDDALHGLAFLHRAFSGSQAPHNEQVRKLLDEIAAVLPKERNREVARLRAVEMQILSRDSQQINPDLLEKLLEACNTHNQITFFYRSPSQADEQPRFHRVEPLRCFVEPSRHHTILEAYYLETDGPKGRKYCEGFRSYRVQRMSDLHVLPQRFVPRTMPRGNNQVIYVLSPEIARLKDVTPVHPGSRIEFRPDGSALVTFWSNNLMMDLKQLLFYGVNCKVIGDEITLKTMRELVEKVWELYQHSED